MANLIYRNYLPTKRTERDQWLISRYAPALSQYGASLGVSPAEIDTVLDGADEMAYQIVFEGYLDAFAKTVTSFTNSLDTAKPRTPVVRPIWNPPAPPTPRVSPALNGYFSFIAELNDRLLALPPETMTPEMKTALGLDPLAPHGPKDAAIDKLDARDGGAVVVHYHLYSNKAVEVAMQRSSEPGIVTTAQSPFDSYTDNRPNKVEGQIESRGYRVRFVLSPTSFSPWSDWLWISTKP